MTNPDPPPAIPPDNNPIGVYDVDAMLIELGGDTGDDAVEAAVCQTVEDVYGSAARFLIAEELADFLEARGITPTEFLHKEEPQRSFLDWPRRTGVLDRIAKLQSRPGRRTPAMRLEELKHLEQEVLAHTARRAHRGTALTIDAKIFAGTVVQALTKTPGFVGRYALDAWLSAWLGEGGSNELRLVRLLSLDSEALSADGVAILDQIIGEMLANGLVIDELFGWVEGLRATLEAIAQVWRGEAIAHPRAPAVVRRLAAFIGTRNASAARRGLEMTIHRALSGDGRLATGGAFDPRAIDRIARWFGDRLRPA